MRALSESETAMIGGGYFFISPIVPFVIDELALIGIQAEVQAQMDQVALDMQRSMLGYDMTES